MVGCGSTGCWAASKIPAAHSPLLTASGSAHHGGAEVHAERPRVSAELPETGERLEGLPPPVVTAPAFASDAPAFSRNPCKYRSHYGSRGMDVAMAYEPHLCSVILVYIREKTQLSRLPSEKSLRFFA